MSYATGEAALLTLIRAITPTTWDTNNSVSIANDGDNKAESVINSGKSWHYLALEPGDFVSDYEDVGWNRTLTQWKTIVTIRAPKETQRGPVKTISDDTQAILNQLDAYARMNNTSGVSISKVRSGTRIRAERIGVGGANAGQRGNRKVFLVRELTIIWEEIADVTQVD